jgi:L-fuculose-phosphate aldolase
MSSSQSLKKDLIAACRRAYERRLVVAHGGNASIKTNSGIIITPAGYSLGALGPRDLILIDFEGRLISGSQEPSTEIEMHLQVYKNRKDVGAAIHTHSPLAISFGMAGRRITPLTPEAKQFLRDVPLLPYRKPGSIELAREVGKCIKDHDILLLERHGVVAVAGNIRNALYLVELLEEQAQIYLFARILDHKL